jgi:integrase
MGRLQYGAGLRVNELLRLRVKDLDFDRGQLVIRGGKGDKDRVTVLPSSLVDSLLLQLEQVSALHGQDVAADFGGASMPEALARKFSMARRELSWQYVFPHSRLVKDPRSDGMLRHHALEILTKMQFAPRPKKWASKNVWPPMCYGTVLRRICWKVGPISAQCKTESDMPRLRYPKSIRM